MANAKFLVIGMSCGHCQAKVEKALKSLHGVYTAIVDLEDGEAEVDFDDPPVPVAGPHKLSKNLPLTGDLPKGLYEQAREALDAAGDVED